MLKSPIQCTNRVKGPFFFKGYGVTERIGRLCTTVLRTASGHAFFSGRNRFTFLETKSLRNVVFFRRSSLARNSCQLWKREWKNGINCFRATWYLRKYESSPSGLQKQDSLFLPKLSFPDFKSRGAIQQQVAFYREISEGGGI